MKTITKVYLKGRIEPYLFDTAPTITERWLSVNYIGDAKPILVYFPIENIYMVEQVVIEDDTPSK
jgi:hypothetical protein